MLGGGGGRRKGRRERGRRQRGRGRVMILKQEDIEESPSLC